MCTVSFHLRYFLGQVINDVKILTEMDKVNIISSLNESKELMESTVAVAFGT